MLSIRVASLVKERITGQLFAIKQVLAFYFNRPNYVHIIYLFCQLRKNDMLCKGQEGHVRAERNILKSAAMITSPGGA
jgi:protein-serine/threonine kinase